MNKSMTEEKYKEAWEKFNSTMTKLKRRRHEILNDLTKKLDKHHIEKIRKEFQNHE